MARLCAAYAALLLVLATPFRHLDIPLKRINVHRVGQALDFIRVARKLCDGSQSPLGGCTLGFVYLRRIAFRRRRLLGGAQPLDAQ